MNNVTGWYMDLLQRYQIQSHFNKHTIKCSVAKHILNNERNIKILRLLAILLSKFVQNRSDRMFIIKVITVHVKDISYC
jgi:hypothetical protein